MEMGVSQEQPRFGMSEHTQSWFPTFALLWEQKAVLEEKF